MTKYIFLVAALIIDILFGYEDFPFFTISVCAIFVMYEFIKPYIRSSW